MEKVVPELTMDSTEIKPLWYFDDGIADGQPQADATAFLLLFCRKIRIKYPGKIFSGNSRSLVFNYNPDVISLFHRPDICPDCCVFGDKLHNAAIRHGIFGINQNIFLSLIHI